MSSSGDSGPGQREVAYRLFAAEFDDCSLSYAESDDERAPNYVLTPTGLRVNRLFAVGVLTEVEAINDETLRGRIVDPTGAFVTYAGQYQPDAQAFLDRTTPPAFVAITGKARTFEPEDSDRVFTSVRPESLSEVEATARDRWVVSAAEATLRRIAICAAALDSPHDGEALQHALGEAGVEESLAAGIPRAIEHYGTTTGYLDALRQLAIDTLELVADEREEVRPLDVAPGEGSDAAVGPLPAIELDLDGLQTASQSTNANTDISEPDTEPPAETAPKTDATETASADAESTDTEPSDTELADSAEPASPGSTDNTNVADSTDPAETTDTAETETSTETVGESASAEPTATAVEDTETAADSPTDGDADADSPTDADSSTPEPASVPEPESEPATDEPAEAGMYQLDDEERAELESEYDTGFSSGNEVDPAGEAGIDVPDVDEIAEQADSETEASDTDDSLGSFEDELGEFEDTEDSVEPETTEASPDDTTEPGTEDIDLEETVITVMAELDDGDGVERSALVAELIDRYGVAETEIEEAIADALMGGRCYEPGDDTLKAI